MKEKVRRLEKDFDESQEEAKNYVTSKHFDAVINPLKEAIYGLQKDVKEILRAVSNRNPRS